MNKIYICDICNVTSETKIVQWCSKTNCYLCAKHRWQIYKYGEITDPTPITIIDANEIEEKEKYAEIILRNRKHEIIAKTIIDLEDIDKCKNIKWGYCPQTGYAYNKTTKNLPLHRFILNYSGSKDIDHINRNKLDNRKQNLRIVDRSENRTNSDVKGAYYRNGKWEVTINRYGTVKHVGTFLDYNEALKAREIAIKELESNGKIKEEYQKRKPESVTGVCAYGKRWRSYININNKRIHLGTFNTKEEAIAARIKAVQEYTSKSAL